MRSGAQYPGEVCAGSQLGQRAADGVAGVRHGSISAGRVRQRVGQRRPLVRQAVFQFDGPLLENLQGGAHALQSLLGLSHGYDMQGKEEGEQEVRLLGRARQCFMVWQCCNTIRTNSFFSAAFWRSHKAFGTLICRSWEACLILYMYGMMALLLFSVCSSVGFSCCLKLLEDWLICTWSVKPVCMSKNDAAEADYIDCKQPNQLEGSAETSTLCYTAALVDLRQIQVEEYEEMHPSDFFLSLYIQKSQRGLNQYSNYSWLQW